LFLISLIITWVNKFPNVLFLYNTNGFHVVFLACFWSFYKANWIGLVWSSTKQFNLGRSQGQFILKIILWKPHDHYANPHKHDKNQHENHYIMKCAWYMPLCPFNCPFRNLGSMYLAFIQISHIHLIGHYLYLKSSIMQETHRTNANGKLSHLYFLETYLEHIKIGLKISFVCCRNLAMHIIFLLAFEAPYKSIICAYGVVDSNYIKSFMSKGMLHWGL